MREFRHAVELAKEEVSLLESESSPQDNAPLLRDMKEALFMGIESINVCVCSFSEGADVLSQWRAYAGRASGFSIGFAGSFLRAVSDEQDFWLVPVLYEEVEQRQLIRTLLLDVLEENVKKRAEAEEDIHPRTGNLVTYLNRYAPILKHKSFSEEREWRIISRPMNCHLERFDYREGVSMLVPYFRIPLSSANRPFQIEKIIVGPAPYPEQSISSVMGLLVKHNLYQAEVRTSEVPYRNW